MEPFRKTSASQNVFSFISHALWNKILEVIKKTTNLKIFRRNLKKY